MLPLLKVVPAGPRVRGVGRRKAIYLLWRKGPYAERVTLRFSERLQIPQITLEVAARKHFVSSANIALRSSSQWREQRENGERVYGDPSDHQ